MELLDATRWLIAGGYLAVGGLAHWMARVHRGPFDSLMRFASLPCFMWAGFYALLGLRVLRPGEQLELTTLISRMNHVPTIAFIVIALVTLRGARR